MEFHAFHGLYPEEKKLGNRFRVDLKILLFLPFDPENTHIDTTVDYARVYELLETEMAVASPLLESLGQRICGKIREAFPLVEELDIAIAKANPAIGGLCEWVKVSTRWKKNP